MPPFARSLAGLCAVTLSTACISNPALGTKATGKPLRVRFDTTSGTYRAQEVVGTSNYYDADGNAAGSVERTQAVTKHWSNTDVSFYQGDDKLDEQDYYRIAGNQGAADEVAAARAQMSRDLTIGFPLAIAGSVASTLAAIGTFGNSAGARYGIGGAATVTMLVGAFFAYRGLETRKKKSMVEPARAIRHASEVERCYRDRCRKEPGGAPLTIQEEVKELRPVVAPQATLTMRKPERTFVGSWSGTSQNTLTQGGRTQKRSTNVQLAIEAGENGNVIVVLEPSDPQSCRLEAKVDGLRAVVVEGQACTHELGKKEMKMTVREGSFELRGNQLEIAMEVEIRVRDTGRRPRRVETMSSSMFATASRM